MSPPISIDMPGVDVSTLLVSCDIATAGAALSNIPTMIAKAAITAAAVRVVFITHDEDTTNLNGIRESYLLFFTPGFLGLPTRGCLHLLMICQIHKLNNCLGLDPPI